MRQRFLLGFSCSFMGILALGAALRFYGITSKGLFFWDEGIHMQEAQYLHSMATGLKEHIGAGALALKVEEKVTGKDLSHVEEGLNLVRSKLKGHYQETAKPTHIALIAASMALFGDHDYCGNVLSALCGTLTIVVIFYLGKLIGGTAVGVTSAFLLAISPLHLIYSRETLAEADSIFFFYCAFLLWYLCRKMVRARMLFLFPAGVAAGLSLTCQNRWIIIPVVFLFMEIAALIFIRGRRIQDLFRNCAILGAGFLLPIVLWQTIYFILKNYMGLLSMDYFNQMKGITAFCAGFSFSYGGVLPLFLTIARFEGVVITLMLVSGIVLACLRKTKADIYLLIVLFFPLALFTFRPHHFTRIFSMAIPCFYLVVGNFLCWIFTGLTKRWPHPRPIILMSVISLVLLALVPNISRDIKIIHWRSRFKEAVEFLTDRGSPNHYSTVGKLSQYYTSDGAVQRPPRKGETGPGAAEIAGFPYLLVDKQKYYQTTFGSSPSDWITQVEKDCTLAFEVREDFDELFFEHFAFEHSVNYWETSAFLKQLPFPEAAMLRIYRLQNCVREKVMENDSLQK